MLIAAVSGGLQSTVSRESRSLSHLTVDWGQSRGVLSAPPVPMAPRDERRAAMRTVVAAMILLMTVSVSLAGNFLAPENLDKEALKFGVTGQQAQDGKIKSLCACHLPDGRALAGVIVIGRRIQTSGATVLMDCQVVRYDLTTDLPELLRCQDPGLGGESWEIVK
jgi:hypothetical protein